MRSQSKSETHATSSIDEYYAVKLRALWRGFRREHACFWMLCTYFFFEYVRPQGIYPEIDVIPFGQITLLATLATVFFDRSVRWVSNIENKLLVLLCLVVFLSGLFAFRPSVSLHHWVSFTNWVLVYFLLIHVINSEKRLFVFILLYLLFSFKMSQHGFRTWAMRGFSFADWGLTGAAGFLRNSGEFAIQMLLFGTLSTAFVLSLRRYWGRYKRLFFYLMPFTGVLCVMGSSSRGAQLALLAIGVWLLLKLRTGLKSLAVLILISAISLFFLPEEQMERFREMGQDETSLQRLTYWRIGIDLIRENPILGVGYANWLDYLGYRYPDGVGVLGEIQQPHNIYIQAGAELGITGLSCFAVMALFAFLLNARTRKAAQRVGNTFLYYLAYGLDAGLIGYLVAGTFVTVFYYPFFWVQTGIVVAAHVIATKQMEARGEPEKAGKRWAMGKKPGGQRTYGKLETD